MSIRELKMHLIENEEIDPLEEAGDIIQRILDTIGDTLPMCTDEFLGEALWEDIAVFMVKNDFWEVDDE